MSNVRAALRASVRAAIRPVLEEFADAVIDLMTMHVDQALEDSVEVARTALASALEQVGKPGTPAHTAPEHQVDPDVDEFAPTGTTDDDAAHVDEFAPTGLKLAPETDDADLDELEPEPAPVVHRDVKPAKVIEEYIPLAPTRGPTRPLYTAAEIVRAKQRVAERAARAEPTPAAPVAADTTPDPTPAPVVGVLPRPRATFTF